MLGNHWFEPASTSLCSCLVGFPRLSHNSHQPVMPSSSLVACACLLMPAQWFLSLLRFNQTLACLHCVLSVAWTVLWQQMPSSDSQEGKAKKDLLVRLFFQTHLSFLGKLLKLRRFKIGVDSNSIMASLLLRDVEAGKRPLLFVFRS